MNTMDEFNNELIRQIANYGGLQKKEKTPQEQLEEHDRLLQEILLKEFKKYHKIVGDIEKASSKEETHNIILQKLKLIENGMGIKEEKSMQEKFNLILSWMKEHCNDGEKDKTKISDNSLLKAIMELHDNKKEREQLTEIAEMDEDEEDEEEEKHLREELTKPTDIPEELKFEGIQKYCGGPHGETLYLLWIKFMKTLPPKWMRLPGNVVDYYGNDIYMNWILYVQKPFPKELTQLQDIMHFNSHGENALMIWLKNVKTTEFPDWMVKKGSEKQLDRDHRNAAMIWLINIQTPFPEWMYYEGIERQFDCETMNIVKLWEKYIKTPYPYDYSKTYYQ